MMKVLRFLVACALFIYVAPLFSPSIVAQLAAQPQVQKGEFTLLFRRLPSLISSLVMTSTLGFFYVPSGHAPFCVSIPNTTLRKTNQQVLYDAAHCH